MLSQLYIYIHIYIQHYSTSVDWVSPHALQSFTTLLSWCLNILQLICLERFGFPTEKDYMYINLSNKNKTTIPDMYMFYIDIPENYTKKINNQLYGSFLQLQSVWNKGRDPRPIMTLYTYISN